MGTPVDRGLMPDKFMARSDAFLFLAQSSEVRGHVVQGTRMAMSVLGNAVNELWE